MRLNPRAPLVLWLVAFGVFAMITSESMTAGLLPTISRGLHVPLGNAALLISFFAAGQVVGAWGVGLPLARFSPRISLGCLLIAFALVQSLGFVSPWYVTLISRVLVGAMMAAYFGIAIGSTAGFAPATPNSRATSTIFAGVTVGTTLGLPASTFLGQALPWQWVYHFDSAAALLAGAAILVFAPTTEGSPSEPIVQMLKPLASGALWLTLVTPALAIGGTLLSFAFFSSILERITGVPPAVVPWLLGLYGVASVVGNWLAGRLSHRGPTGVVAVGLVVLTAGLILFWALPAFLPTVLVALVAVGLTGVALNPAHTARTLHVGGNRPAVVLTMPMVVTGGILLGSSLGAAIVDSPLGLLATLSLGALFTSLALLSLLPMGFRLLRGRLRRDAEPPTIVINGWSK